MKTIVVGFKDAAGSGSPVIVLGLNVKSADQMAVFSKARTEHIFPSDFKRLVLCEVKELSIAVEIPSARNTLKKHFDGRRAEELASSGQRTEKLSKQGEAHKLAKEKRIEAQKSRLAFPEKPAEEPAKSADQENSTKDEEMKNKKTPSTVAQAATLIAIIFSLFVTPITSRAAEPVYAPESLATWVQNGDSTTNWLNVAHATNGPALIGAQNTRNVPFEIQVQTDASAVWTNTFVICPTVSFLTNRLSTNQNVTLTLTGAGGVTNYTWGTNIDSVGWGGWYLITSSNWCGAGNTYKTTNVFGYGMKKGPL